MESRAVLMSDQYALICLDTPSAKIVCQPWYLFVTLSHRLQKYSANVTSVLPVLLSAIRQSPPSGGTVHDGKVIGQDPVTYTYEQVCRRYLHAYIYFLMDYSPSLSLRISSRLRVATWGTGRFLKSPAKNGPLVCGLNQRWLMHAIGNSARILEGKLWTYFRFTDLDLER